MKHFLFAALLLLPVVALAIPGDSLPKLELGKRLNFMFSRTIRPENVANWQCSNSKIFFRPNYQSDYQSIGYMGKNIEPYFTGNLSAQTSFEKFRQNKKWSTACQVGSIAAGVYSMVNFFKIFETIDSADSVKSYGLNAGLGLIASIGLGIGYRVLMIKSERHLVDAVQTVNGFPAKTSSIETLNASFSLSSDQSPGLALRLRF